MSGYEHYEFWASDRALTKAEQQELRDYSSRAEINARSFVVGYSYGDFKGDEDKWLARYFDVYVHTSSYGDKVIKMSFPSTKERHAQLKSYEVMPGLQGEESCSTIAVTEEGDRLIVTIASHDNSESHWIDEGDRWCPALSQVREQIMGGDMRGLYIAWMACATWMSDVELDEEDEEDEGMSVGAPPVPPGLEALDDGLDALASLIEADPDMIAAAAPRGVAPAPTMSAAEWVAGLAAKEKDALLVELIEAPGPEAWRALGRRYREEAAGAVSGGVILTPAELIALADSHGVERERSEAEAAASARRAYLQTQLGKSAELWASADALAGAGKPSKYPEVVELLCTLRDLALYEGALDSFMERSAQFRRQHATKRALMERLADAKV